MLLLALHLATASIHPVPAPPSPEVVLANPDGGKKRRDGKDDEDVR